ncbi:MAG: phage minor capsid protein [Schaedlerella sp.]|nr:phage minor capsid protein [Schaedlerella sp.]
MKKSDTEKISLRMENIWLKAEERIMADIVRRIQKTGKITSTADYQINRLIEMGKSTEEVERLLKEALDATYPEMFKLYDDVANWQYVRNKDIYEQINGEFIPPEDNEQLKQISEAIKTQTGDELENLARSYGFTVPVGNKRVFTPFSQYYQQYVDNAIMDVLSGGYDYNTVIRRVVTQMTNSGLRSVDFASGRSNRVPVAARRAILSGVAQITGKVSEYNAAKLGTNYFEVDWHAGARQEHREWQGKVYTYEQLQTICGLGTVTGLHGANCYHDYYAFVPGASERLYTDEWLEEQNRKEEQTKEWQGKEYDAYGRTQKQRQMETSMRAQREKVQLLKEAKVDDEEIMIAKAKYQAQLNEYSQFCKEMGLKEQRERIYYDMRGRVAPTMKTKAFTDQEGNAIIKSKKMYRKKAQDSIEPMPKKQLQRIVKGFKRSGGIIQMNDATDAYLTTKKAEAITYNDKTILLKQKPGRAAVFEELIHATQFRKGENDGSYESRLRCEISAQNKLLKYRKSYKLTKQEVKQTEKALKAYQKELDELLKEVTK